MKEKKKIRIDMSVEMDVLVDDKNKKEDIDTIVKNYFSCLGDKDIKIEKVEFV